MSEWDLRPDEILPLVSDGVMFEYLKSIGIMATWYQVLQMIVHLDKNFENQKCKRILRWHAENGNLQVKVRCIGLLLNFELLASHPCLTDAERKIEGILDPSSVMGRNRRSPKTISSEQAQNFFVLYQQEIINNKI